VARILIFEPHADISALLELVVRRLGHEPVVVDGVMEPTEEVDAAVIEPGDGSGLPLARQLYERHVPVVFASIFPADQELLALDPVSYLIKPFALYELEAALGEALATVEPPVQPHATV
jgi:DNA-binding response OmpR family regulator